MHILIDLEEETRRDGDTGVMVGERQGRKERHEYARPSKHRTRESRKQHCAVPAPSQCAAEVVTLSFVYYDRSHPLELMIS